MKFLLFIVLEFHFGFSVNSHVLIELIQMIVHVYRNLSMALFLLLLNLENFVIMLVC